MHSIGLTINRVVGLLWSGFGEEFGHRRIIREHYVSLVNKLDAKSTQLINKLGDAEVLRDEDKESINNDPTSFRQNENLLSVLSRKPKDQFGKFLDALEETGQQHVRNQIENTAVKVSQLSVVGKINYTYTTKL